MITDMIKGILKLKLKYPGHLFFILFLILFSIFFTYPLYNPNNSKGGSDFRNGDTPAYFFIKQSIEDKSLPLWDRLTFSGRPRMGLGQPLLYPPAILLSLFFEPYGAMNILLILHVLLAGLGMYFLTYYVTKNKEASLISGIIYMFSPYMMAALLRHPFWVAGIVYIPLEFLIVKLAVDKKEYFKYSILLGIILALHFLSGGVLQWYFGVAIIILYLGYSALGKSNKIIKSLLICFIFGIVMFCLIAPRFLPAQEYTSLTTRSSLSKQEIKQVGYLNFDNFIYKMIYPIGQTKEGNTSYGTIGLAGLFLMLYGLWYDRKNKFVIFLFLVSIGIIIYASGIFLDLFYLIPGVSSQRGLDRSLILFVVCGSILAGIGYNKLKKFKWKFFVILSLVIGSLFLMNISQLIFQNDKFEHYNITESNPVFLKIAEDDDIFRFHVAEVIGIDWNDFMGASIPLELESVYGTMGGGWNKFYFNQFLSAAMQNPTKMWGILNVKYIVSNNELISDQVELVDKYNVEGKTISADNYKDGVAYLYKNNEYLPRVFIPNFVISVNSLERVYGAMLSDDVDLSTTIVIEKRYEEIKQVGSGTANIIEYKPNSMTVEVNNEDDTYLFISEKYTLYSGWSATVDGKPTNIILADGILSAVYLPADSHYVVFTYCPNSFKMGVVLCLIMLCTLIFVFTNKYIYKG